MSRHGFRGSPIVYSVYKDPRRSDDRVDLRLPCPEFIEAQELLVAHMVAEDAVLIRIDQLLQPGEYPHVLCLREFPFEHAVLHPVEVLLQEYPHLVQALDSDVIDDYYIHLTTPILPPHHKRLVLRITQDMLRKLVQLKPDEPFVRHIPLQSLMLDRGSQLRIVLGKKYLLPFLR